MWLQLFCVFQILSDNLVGIHRQRVVDPREDLVLFVESRLDLLSEDLLVEEILHPDPKAGVLVGIGGSDPLLGGADLVLAEVPLDRRIQFAVIGA